MARASVQRGSGYMIGGWGRVGARANVQRSANAAKAGFLLPEVVRLPLGGNRAILPARRALSDASVSSLGWLWFRLGALVSICNARVRRLIPHRKVSSPSPRHSPANWRIYATGKTASPHGNRLSLAELLLPLGATRFSRIKKSAERTDDLLRRIHSYSYVLRR
jgi:hypothetical protein